MFFVIKKSNVLFMLSIVFVSVIALNGALWYNETVPTLAQVSNTKAVILDAGHGDIDGGAVGNSGTIEKDINLAITKHLQSLLERSGTKVVLTRSDDNAIIDTEGKTVRQIKRDDLKYRRDLRDSGAGEIFVSIHMNKFPNAKYSGAQVFYASNPDKSRILGETIQKNMIDILDKSNTRVAKQAESTIYILKESTIPSVIVECGFLSNANEEKLLANEEYQKKVAWAIFAGIKEYFETSEKK